MDWVGLLDKNVRAPIVPHYPHPGDTSNFEKYPEAFDTDHDHVDGEDPFKDLFVGFS